MKSTQETDALVLTHGFASGLGYFFRNFPHLSVLNMDGISVYAIDWAGKGRSSRTPMKSLHLDDVEDYFVDSLEEWRIKMNIKQMILFGHSFGGYLSTVYAIKYPMNVKTLILCSPVGFPEKPLYNYRAPPTWIRICWEWNITPQVLLRLLGPFSQLVVSTMAGNRFKFLSATELELLENYMLHINLDCGAGEFAMSPLLLPGAYAKSPLIRRFKNVKCPTTFIYGKQDWMHTSGGYDSIQSHPNSQLHKVVLCEGGHFCFLDDNFEEFNKLLINIVR